MDYQIFFIFSLNCFQQQYIFIHHCLLYVLEKENPSLFFHSFASINGDKFVSNNINHLLPNGTRNSCSTFNTFMVNPPSASHQIVSHWSQTPKIEVHQNLAFEDDEGIAESGL